MKIPLRNTIILLSILSSCQRNHNKVIKYGKVDSATTVTQPIIENHELTPEERIEKKNRIIEALTQSKQNDTMLFLGNGLTTSLSFFPDTDYAVMIADTPIQFGYQPVEKSFHDFDNDGIKELILEYFTGGAHCCYENYIFRKISKNQFKQIFYNEGGYMEVIGKNKIHIWVGGKFSYFYSCYSCLIDESVLGESIRPKATFVLKNGRFGLTKDVDEKRNKKLLKYLKILSKRPVPPLSKDDFQFDDGTRKLYALILLEYYLNNGCNSSKCEKLFFEYYKEDDSKIIWADIKSTLEYCLEVQFADFP